MNNNRCLFCGSIIPEGRQICWHCENAMDKEPRIPTAKQIELADDIADVLNINFPQSSKDFTARNYWAFIKENINEAQEYWCGPSDDDDEMMWFSPINQ